MRVFLDASVLFAAAYSTSGASREIIQRGIRGQIGLVVSELVLEETRRNLRGKAPEAIPSLEMFREAATFETIRASRGAIEQAMRYTAAKDAPVVAAAREARVDYLVSLDRRHLVGVPHVGERSGLVIVLPGDLLKELRETEG